MEKISRDRGRQAAASSGLGIPYSSPLKSRKRKTQTKAYTCLNQDTKRRRLEREFEMLLNPPPIPEPGPVLKIPEVEDSATADLEIENEWVPVEDNVDHASCHEGCEPKHEDDNEPKHEDDNAAKHEATLPGKKRRRITPDQATIDLYAKWKLVLPSLVEPLLTYTSESIRKPLQPVGSCLKGECNSKALLCGTKDTKILCLYFDHFLTINLTSCACQSISQILVRNGLFPTAPGQIRMAVSIDFLDFYGALFERSCDAVNAMAAALNTFYTRRGYYLTSDKGERYKEPFRRGLGYASQWLDGLRVLIETQVESVLKQADKYLQARVIKATPLQDSATMSAPPLTPTVPFTPSIAIPSCASNIPSTPPPPPLSGSSQLPDEPEETAEAPGPECSRFLRQLCPACFGGKDFGRSLEDGGDFQIATDGNFHHRHLVSGGQSIPFHDPKHIIPKSFVDAVGEDILKARKSPPKKRQSKVPDSAVDECEKSHDAADGDKKKNSSDDSRYDDRGWMSLVCRHDIPLFFANIDTPGEQQKYAVALILWFFQQIPPKATTTVLYDIGCVMDRSVQLFGILPLSVACRVLFVTTAMHAYGHQWACQLEYNPRLRKGLGLTDGEGVERTWSRLRKLIPIVRTSSRARRLWLTDRQLSAVASELRDDLGDWVNRRHRRGVLEQRKKAKSILDKCGVGIDELREQWELQKEAQLSIRSHAPARLKKELDSILGLQGDLETVEKALNAAKAMVATSNAPAESKLLLTGLRDTHQQLTEKVEELYVSLNIHDSYPDLKGVNLDFIRTLLMARDLKMNIRKRAIGSFFEWDRLGQAVGGRSQTLGTKLHQQTRKAITKRTPALMTAIKKFNSYCVKLAKLYDPVWNIPLPLPLPTKLAELRDNSSLMEDVWITPTETKMQRWLEDPDVRSGIHAMLKLDRCLEEQRRLGLEADNLCRWFGRELGAVELAIRTPSCELFGVQLVQYRDHLLHLKSRWASPFATSIRFDAHVTMACQVASQLTGCQEAPIIKWIHEFHEVEMPTQDNSDNQLIDENDFLEKEAYDPHDVVNRHDKLVTDEEVEEILVSDIFQAEKDELEDTSCIDYAEKAANLVWEPLSLIPDDDLINFIKDSVIAPTRGQRYQRRLFGNFKFEAEELRMFDTSNAMLNDVCLSGSAAILQAIFIRNPRHHISAQKCAIFSTHDLTRIRYKATDAELWRNTRNREYWTKDVWIIPIHRPSQYHWVLAVVYLEHGEIHLFDSLAGRKPWKKDIQDVSILISRLSELSNREGHPIPIQLSLKWVAQPAIVNAVQSNGYDCGLWVLAWIAGILRGYNTTGHSINESVMPAWRALLGKFVRAMPPT